METSGSPPPTMACAAEAKWSWSACLSDLTCRAWPLKPQPKPKAPAKAPAKALPHRTITRTTYRLLLTLCSHPELPAQQSFHEHSARSFASDIRSTRHSLSLALSKPTSPKRLVKRERLLLCIATSVSASLVPFRETALIWIVILRPTRLPAAPSGLLASALSISPAVSRLGTVGIGVRNIQLYCGRRVDIEVSGDALSAQC